MTSAAEKKGRSQLRSSFVSKLDATQRKSGCLSSEIRDQESSVRRGAFLRMAARSVSCNDALKDCNRGRGLSQGMSCRNCSLSNSSISRRQSLGKMTEISKISNCSAPS